nr:flagellar filament capping protein FliD [Clostridium sp.]
MTNRVTGLASGLDVESLVSSELASYKSKITQEQQNKATLQIQQELYRGVIKQGSDFYNKYLDVTKSDSLLLSSKYSSTVFSSSNENIVTAKSVSGAAIQDTYTVDVTQLASTASTVLKLSQFNSTDKSSIYVEINGKEQEIDISSILNSGKDDKAKNNDLVTALNNNLNDLGLKAAYSEISGGIILQTKEMGKGQSFEIGYKDGAGNKNVVASAEGKDAEYVIKSSTNTKGQTFSSSSNTVTHDGIQFSFTTTTEKDNPVVITGKTDSSSTVDAISNFFDDYNSMLTNFQTLLTEKHDKDYKPLTEEQKSAMTDSQIEKWEKKVKTGQLRNDNLVQSLVTQMRSIFASKTAELKEIGITTVSKYDSSAGTFTVDKDKLKAALEKDPNAVMRLFNKAEDTIKGADGENETVAGSGGLFTNLKTVLYDNTISTSKSRLIAKAGTESFNSNSTITKQLNSYAKKISQMESTLT